MLVAKAAPAGRYNRAALIVVSAALAVGSASVGAGCTFQDHAEAMYGCPPVQCPTPDPNPLDGGGDPGLIPADASVGDARADSPSEAAADAAQVDGAADAGADGDAAVPE